MKAWECGRNLLTSMITLEDICLRMQTVIDRTVLPNIVNTQILNPFKNTDPAVKMAFPGVNVNDKEQANVRPPNPSLCVGNGFIIETTDLVRLAVCTIELLYLFCLAKKRVHACSLIRIGALMKPCSHA